MVTHSLALVAIALSILKGGLAQGEPPSNTTAEAAALDGIVEDDPGDIFTIQKDWLSPEYSLIYKVALPIPPVKQPKMYVHISVRDQTYILPYH